MFQVPTGPGTYHNPQSPIHLIPLIYLYAIFTYIFSNNYRWRANQRVQWYTKLVYSTQGTRPIPWSPTNRDGRGDAVWYKYDFFRRGSPPHRYTTNTTIFLLLTSRLVQYYHHTHYYTLTSLITLLITMMYSITLCFLVYVLVSPYCWILSDSPLPTFLSHYPLSNDVW